VQLGAASAYVGSLHSLFAGLRINLVSWLVKFGNLGEFVMRDKNARRKQSAMK
jgi:hypothetical protein